MSKSITEQATNSIRISGTLIDIAFREGKLKTDGRPYASATATVRVTQTYGGREETSEYLVDMFAPKYTKQNQLSASYDNIQNMRNWKTAQQCGIEEASRVYIRNGSIRENNYVANSGNLVSGWRINTPFMSQSRMQDTGNFDMTIFIMDMHEEMDRDGDPTGRLIIKGGIVQYGGNLDVIEFVVEDPNKVDYLSRNWEINDTVRVQGYIRCTSQEEKVSKKTSSWGEEIPSFASRLVKELIIVNGDDTGREEEQAYDPVEIKKAFNVRKAKLEQLQIDAKAKAESAASAPKSDVTSKQYDWE